MKSQPLRHATLHDIRCKQLIRKTGKKLDLLGLIHFQTLCQGTIPQINFWLMNHLLIVVCRDL